MNLNKGFIYYWCCIVGFVFNMQWGPAAEFASEVGYPVGEANTIGFITFWGCLTGAILGAIIPFIKGIGVGSLLIYIIIEVCIKFLKFF